jgi:hypothetical protein
MACEIGQRKKNLRRKKKNLHCLQALQTHTAAECARTQLPGVHNHYGASSGGSEEDDVKEHMLHSPELWSSGQDTCTYKVIRK